MPKSRKRKKSSKKKRAWFPALKTPVQRLAERQLEFDEHLDFWRERRDEQRTNLSEELIQSLVISVGVDGALQVTKLADELNRLGGVAQSAGAKAAKGMGAAAGATAALDGALQNVRASVAPVSTEFGRLRDMVGKLGDRYAETGRIGVQQITALSLTVKELERAHGGAITSATRLSDAERKIYDSARASLKDAIAKQREFNDEQGKISRATREWNGLNGAISGLNGPLGRVAVGVGGVIAAFSEGWRIGRQFDKWLEGNIGWWKRWKEVSTDAIRGANAELINNLNLSERTRALLPQIIARQNQRRLYEGVVSGVHTSIGLGVERGLVDGARRGAPQVARIIQEHLRHIPGLSYLGPQSLGDVLAGMDPIPDPALATRIEQLFSRTALKIPITASDVKLTPGAMRDLSTQFGNAIAPGLSEALTDVALTGGRNLGDVMGQAFQEHVREGADQFIGILGGLFTNLFGGGSQEIVERNGQFFVNGSGQAFSTREAAFAASNQGRTAAGIGAGVGAAQIGVGAYQQAYQGGSLLSGTIGGGLAGAGIGLGLVAAGAAAGSVVPIIGTIVGAVVGLVASYFGARAASEDQQFGVPSIRDGVARFGGTQSYGVPEIREVEAQIQSTFNDFWTRYQALIIEYGVDSIPDLADFDFQGRVQGAPSSNFAKHLQEWIAGTLPDEVAGFFREGMENIFTTLGGTAERFDYLWREFDRLDPRETVELWTLAFQAMRDMQDSLSYFEMPFAGEWSGGAFGNADQSLIGDAQSRNRRSFADEIREGDRMMIRFASHVSDLTSEEQIRSAARLGEMMRQRMETEIEFFQQLARSIENTTRMLDAFLLDLDLQQMITPEGEPDYAAQIDRLRGEGERIWNQLQAATSPAEIEFLSGEWVRINQSILGAAQNLGPAAYQEFIGWIQENTQAFRTDVLARYRLLGEEVEAANRDYIGAMREFVAAIRSLVPGLGEGDGSGGGDRPEHPPIAQPIDPGQWATIESANSYLGEISSTDREMLAELVAIRSQGGTAQKVQVSVGVGGTLRIEDAEGNYIQDVQLRRMG